MRVSTAILALPAALLLAGCVSQQAEAPDYRVLSDAEAAASLGCEQKGIIEVDLNALHQDVSGVRTPGTRLAVARLGGNAILMLPGRDSSNHAIPAPQRAAVFACPVETVR